MATNPREKREKLYSAMVKNKAYTKSYAEFENQFSNAESIQKLYNGLKEHGAVTEDEGVWTDRFFSDLLVKKKVPSFQEQMGERFAGSSQPLPHPSKPSSEESPALTAESESVEDKIRAFHKESYENKHGKPAEPEKTSFAVLPEFSDAMMQEATQKSDSLGGIYEKKFQVQLDALKKQIQSKPLKEGEDPNTREEEFLTQAESVKQRLMKLMQDQEEIEYAKLGQKYEKLSAEKSKTKKDAGVAESFGKQAYNVFANMLPQAASAADSEKLSTFDVKPREDGSLRFNAEDWEFGSTADTRLLDDVVRLEGNIDDGGSLADLAADETFHPDVRQALTETIGGLKGKANKDVIKSTFAFMLNRQMGRRKARNVQEIEKQQQESSELLANVPLTWSEAKEAGNISGYIGGALGQGLGSSLATVPLGVIPGARALEYSEVYSQGLQAKAKRKSDEWGTQVSAEDIALMNDDADVIETASMMGNINAGLETVGMMFGLGSLAKGIFTKKLQSEIVKKGFGRHAMDALTGTIASTAVGATTEAVQSANTLAGSKKLLGAKYKDAYSNMFVAAVNKVLGRKIEQGQTLDDAAASITEEEINEIFESFRQGAIAEGVMGGVGDFTSLAKTGRQMYIDKKRGAAITREQAEKMIDSGSKDVEVINDPVLSAKFQVGITSATDRVPEVKALMDEARAANERGDTQAAEAAYNKVLDIGEKKITEHISKVPGAKITLDRSKGNFFGYTEPTFAATLEVPADKVNEALAEIATASEDMKQDAAHVSQVRNMKLGKDEQYGIEDADGWVNEPNIDITFDNPISNEEFQGLVQMTQEEAELAGFTLHSDGKGINLYNISKFTPYEEFVGKATRLKEALESRGIGHRAKASVRRLLNMGGKESGATRSYAEIRDKVRPQEAQLTPPQPVDPANQKRIEGIIGKAQKSLSKIAPDLNVVYYNGGQEGAAALKRVDPQSTFDPNSNGFYSNNTIGIDLSKADASTAFHEAIHPIMDVVRERKPELFASIADEAASAKVLLEDGNYQKYLDYADGNKEEALVEYLAHFAEDQSAPQGVIAKIKDFVSRVLEAIGLSPKDFNLDLNNVKDLEQMAKGLSQALNRGKTISVNGGTAPATSGARFQTSKKQKRMPKMINGKPMNRTARKLAQNRRTEFKDQRVKILKNPENYTYDPQKFKDIDQWLESKSDYELDQMIDINNPVANLAAIKLLRRLNEKGLDTDNVFQKFRKIGTSAAQLLRQMGELKSYNHNDIVAMVEKNLESLGLMLTDDQYSTLEQLAKDYTQANLTLDTKKEAFKNGQATIEELDHAEKDLAKKFQDLNVYVSKVTPMGLDSMVATILQGNLLTSQSIVTNVAGNVIQQSVRAPELAMGDMCTYIANRGWENENGIMKVISPMEIFFSSMFRGMAGWAKGWPMALKDITYGRGDKLTDSATLELKRQLNPLQALKQFAMAAVGKNKTLPVTKNGKVAMHTYIEKAFEGTMGASAEVMFRMLYLGDKPFRNAAKEAAQYRLFREAGGKATIGTSSEYRKFLANMTPEQKKQIDKYMNEATMSDDRTLAKLADGGMKLLLKGIDLVADHSPSDSFRRYVAVMLRTFVKANMPFIRVPSNIAQMMVELMMPPLTFFAGLSYFKKGDVRKGSMLLTRAMTGMSFYYLGNILYDAGVTIASSEGDDDKERQLKYEVGLPNGINIDALARLQAGIQDPNNPFQPDDRVWSFDRFGVPGLILAANAEFNENIKKDLGKSRSEAGWIDASTKAIGASLKTFMEAPFLHGSFMAQKAMASGDMTNYFAELGNTMSALVLPNQVRTNTMAHAEYILRADDPSTWNKFMEKQSIKIFPSLKDNIAGVYPIIGMFGEPVRANPDVKAGSTDALLYQYFNITKSKKMHDPRSIEIYNLYKRTGELGISQPTPRIGLGEGVSLTLHEQDYVYAQMLAGEMKAQLLGLEMNQDYWKGYTDQEKLATITEANKRANKAAKDYMLQMISDGIDAGTITFDEETGAYNYVAPSEFDFDYAKKAMAED